MIESEVFKRYQLPIEELRPKIIDTIVEVYGKRHRAQIEDRLNNLYINSHMLQPRMYKMIIIQKIAILYQYYQ